MSEQQDIEPTYPFKFQLNDTVLHVKSGGFYSIRGLPDENTLEHNGQPSYAYGKIGQKRKFHRSQVEMEDGRFVKVSLSAVGV